MDVYLIFKREAGEAITFYESVFGVTCKDKMTFGQAPAGEQELPAQVADLIMNASLEINGTRVMFSDAPEELGPTVTFGDNVSLVLQANNEAEIDNWYAALTSDADIKLPLAPTFWAKKYAILVDKFGVNWMLNLAQ